MHAGQLTSQELPFVESPAYQQIPHPATIFLLNPAIPPNSEYLSRQCLVRIVVLRVIFLMRGFLYPASSEVFSSRTIKISLIPDPASVFTLISHPAKPIFDLICYILSSSQPFLEYHVSVARSPMGSKKCNVLRTLSEKKIIIITITIFIQGTHFTKREIQ